MVIMFAKRFLGCAGFDVISVQGGVAGARVETVGKCGSIIEAAATTQSAINDSAQRKPTAGLALSFLFTLHVVQLCEMEHVSPFARAKGRQSETLNVSPPPLVLLRMPVVLNPDLHITSFIF
jgi:hypothetical protein